MEIFMAIERLSALPAARALASAVRSRSVSAVAREEIAGGVAVRVRPITADAARGITGTAISYGTNGSTAHQRTAAMSKQLKGAPRGVPPRGRPV